MLATTTRELLATALVVSLSAILFVIHLTHIVHDGWESPWILVGAVAPLVLVVAVAVGVVWLYDNNAMNATLLRVNGWVLVGAAMFLLAVLMTIEYQHVEGGIIAEQGFMLCNAMSGGAAIGFVFGVYDGNRLESQRQIERARARTASLNQKLSVLNRVLRHDIRNHATAIKGYAYNIQNSHPSVDEETETIERNADRLVEISELARKLDSVLGPDANPTEPVDFVALVSGALSTLTDRYPELTVETSLPVTRSVYGHQELDIALLQVFEHLIRHNGSEQPRLEIAMTPSRDGSEYVDLTVSTDDASVPADVLAVLERGFETALEHGDGLGLWIANWTIEASGGELAVTNGESSGSTVRIRLERSTDGEEPD